MIRTPVREANAIAERFVRTIRTECLDWLLILNRRHLERVVTVSVWITTTPRGHTGRWNSSRLSHRGLRPNPPTLRFIAATAGGPSRVLQTGRMAHDDADGPWHPSGGIGLLDPP